MIVDAFALFLNERSGETKAEHEKCEPKLEKCDNEDDTVRVLAR